MATAALNRYTPEEYLALERNAEFKSEYLNGRIIAMTGGSIPHNYIAGNIYAGLLARFSGRSCHVFIADIKVRFGRGINYTYPDVMALCGAPGYGDEHRDILTNPALVVEVLSNSTQAYDRGDKFKGYKAIDSLREYLLVSQDEVKVEHFVREGDFWPSTLVTDLDATVELRSVGCTLPMRDIYRRTGFVPEDMAEELA